MKFKYIGILIIAAIFIVLYYAVNPLEVGFFPKCPFYLSTGFYCPGCGSQRATHQLLHFNFMGVIKQNLLYFSALLFFVFHAAFLLIQRVFNMKPFNIMYHPKTPIIILMAVLLFWIFRNLPWFPFYLLAPHF